MKGSPPVTYQASAPVRLDFAGGWTDVAPYCHHESGVVVNAAINLRVYAEFEPGGTGLLLRAQDVNQAAAIRSAADLALNGQLDLHKAALRMLPTGPGTLRTRSDVPPGSGLGSSGALDVALVAVLARARGEEQTAEELAANGHYLEAVEAGMAGGSQDQYAAALGGFNRLTFHGDVVGVERLTLDPEFRRELERRILICYTGKSRVSGETITRVMQAYAAGHARVADALRELAQLANDMAAALVAADLPRVGRLLSANWAAQQRLDEGIVTPEMRELEARLRPTGILGGKAAGAGAGGCMFFLTDRDPEPARKAAEGAGIQVLPARWAESGVEVC